MRRRRSRGPAAAQEPTGESSRRSRWQIVVVLLALTLATAFTFGPVRSSKDQLTNPIAFTVTMRTPAGALAAQSPRFEPPPIGLAPWDGRLTETEQISFLKWRAGTPGGPVPEGGLPP